MVNLVFRLRRIAANRDTPAETAYLLYRAADLLDNITQTHHTTTQHNQYHHRPYCPTCEHLATTLNNLITENT